MYCVNWLVPYQYLNLSSDGHLPIFLSLYTSGTRIIYDRKFLLGCRSSPVAKTPPRGLPDIPGVTSPPSKDTSEKARKGELLNNNNITAPDSTNTGMFTVQTRITRCTWSSIWSKRLDPRFWCKFMEPLKNTALIRTSDKSLTLVMSFMDNGSQFVVLDTGCKEAIAW